jgi:hypothetical protein
MREIRVWDLPTGGDAGDKDTYDHYRVKLTSSVPESRPGVRVAPTGVGWTKMPGEPEGGFAYEYSATGKTVGSVWIMGKNAPATPIRSDLRPGTVVRWDSADGWLIIESEA